MTRGSTEEHIVKSQLLAFILLVGVANAKHFTRCELARTLQAAGMDGYAGVGLADWMCLASTASSYNTQTTTRNSDGSTSYGIFQINNRRWCSSDQVPSYNSCRISCSQLLTDDITADIECAKTIANQQSILFWPGWQANCQARELGQYIAGCEL